jgi:hypothetical protein
MATTTPNYGWDVPTSTDYVKDGATAIESLGDDIDASLFSITGGKNTGLVPITTQTFSNVSGVTVDNVFNATYANYLIRASISTASGSPTRLIGQLVKNDGTLYTATQYYQSFAWYRNTTSAQSAEGSLLSNFRMNVSSPYGAGVVMNLSDLQGQDPLISGQVTGFDYNSSFGAYVSSGSTIMRGIRFFQDAGNISGTIRVYGVRNS